LIDLKGKTIKKTQGLFLNSSLKKNRHCLLKRFLSTADPSFLLIAKPRRFFFAKTNLNLKLVAEKDLLGDSKTNKNWREVKDVFNYSSLTVSFFLPFFLRLVKTAWPEEEAARFLKPCLFFLLRLLI
tara:strand:- start:586 stop:966 length:381 start_codon:yes stop_codon:yes gene_type:complete